MKKKIMVCSLIAILLAITAFSTTAYFTTEDQATNVITAGDIKIELQQGQETFEVLPGKEIDMSSNIKNVGSESAWIRASIEKSIQLAEGKQGEVDLELISFNFDTEQWKEKDGYYYYNNELKSGETATPLYTKVAFSPNMKNKYQESKVKIEIHIEATQSKNNGDNVMDAGGWPKK